MYRHCDMVMNKNVDIKLVHTARFWNNLQNRQTGKTNNIKSHVYS